MSGRFDSVQYDSYSAECQGRFKAKFQDLEAMVAGLGAGRPQSLVLTKLEEAYMWVDKALRDLQEERWQEQRCRRIREQGGNA